VDGKPRPSRRTTKPNVQVYSVNLGKAAVGSEWPVVVSFTYRVLVQKHGHLLHLDMARPTKGLNVHFAYGNCGIRHVNVLEYVAGSQLARISRRPATDPAPAIDVDFDGWVLPKAGVAFAWVLDEEIRASAQP